MRWLVFSHLFIAFCAVAMTLETIVFSGMNITKNIPYLTVVFFSTLIAYNLKNIKWILFINEGVKSEKRYWVKKNNIFLCLLFGLSLILLFIGLFFLNQSLIYLLLPLGVLSIGYSWPLRIGGYKIVLREIPFIKTLLVALVWTIVVVVLPYVDFANIRTINWAKVIGEFMFLLSLALLFDIKDMESDKNRNIKTIPLIVGVVGTKALSVSIILSRMLFYCIVGLNPAQLILELFIAIICLIVIVAFVNKKTSVYFYMLGIDGLMFLKSFLVILFLLKFKYAV